MCEFNWKAHLEKLRAQPIPTEVPPGITVNLREVFGDELVDTWEANARRFLGLEEDDELCRP